MYGITGSILLGKQHFQSSPRTSMLNSGYTDQALFRKDEISDNHIPLQAPSMALATTSSAQLLTPSSTPTTQRRNRRISNLFVR